MTWTQTGINRSTQVAAVLRAGGHHAADERVRGDLRLARQARLPDRSDGLLPRRPGSWAASSSGTLSPTPAPARPLQPSTLSPARRPAGRTRTQTINTPAGGPFVSTNSYAWAAGTNSSPIGPVDGSDAVGNTTTDNLTFDGRRARPDREPRPSRARLRTTRRAGRARSRAPRPTPARASMPSRSRSRTRRSAATAAGTARRSPPPARTTSRPTGRRAGATHSPPAR